MILGSVTRVDMKRSRDGLGFTLIELVLVLALIAIVLAMTVATAFPGREKTLYTEADRLAQLWARAYDAVQLDGQTIIWEADSLGYRFLRREGGQLKLITDEPILRARSWLLHPMQVRTASSLSISYVSGRWQLALERGGGSDPFRIELVHGDLAVALRGDGLGNFSAQP